MRLLNVKTFKLTEFFESELPPYAILSHTWGREEVTFRDIQGPAAAYDSKQGYYKIKYTCAQAYRDGYKYAWIDTCCIDKSSSSELSEAINSMFRWYEQAGVCYAYLIDVPTMEAREPHELKYFLSRSRWFTRGWTLQELLAPSSLIFFISGWSKLATRAELADQLGSITGIDPWFLRHQPVRNFAMRLVHPQDTNQEALYSRRILLRQASVAQRMSWASKRKTTREEDMAYCLLGIFGVNMPLIYGEGEMAFIRLQEEIIKRFDDQSIFAWGIGNDPALIEESPVWALRRNPRERRDRRRGQPPAQSNHEPNGRGYIGILARSPADFEASGNVLRCNNEDKNAFAVTNKGIQATLSLSDHKDPYAMLQCYLKNDPISLLAIPLRFQKANQYMRVKGNISRVHRNTWSNWSKEALCLLTQLEVLPSNSEPPENSLLIRNTPPGFVISKISPETVQTYPFQYVKTIFQMSDSKLLDKQEICLTVTKEGCEDKILVNVTIRKMHTREIGTILPMWWTSYWITDPTYYGITSPPSKYTKFGFATGVVYVRLSRETISGRSLFVLDMCTTMDRQKIQRLAVTNFFASRALRLESFMLNKVLFFQRLSVHFDSLIGLIDAVDILLVLFLFSSVYGALDRLPDSTFRELGNRFWLAFQCYAAAVFNRSFVSSTIEYVSIYPLLAWKMSRGRGAWKWKDGIKYLVSMVIVQQFCSVFTHRSSENSGSLSNLLRSSVTVTKLLDIIGVNHAFGIHVWDDDESGWTSLFWLLLIFSTRRVILGVVYGSIE